MMFLRRFSRLGRHCGESPQLTTLEITFCDFKTSNSSLLNHESRAENRGESGDAFDSRTIKWYN